MRRRLFLAHAVRVPAAIATLPLVGGLLATGEPELQAEVSTLVLLDPDVEAELAAFGQLAASRLDELMAGGAKGVTFINGEWQAVMDYSQ